MNPGQETREGPSDHKEETREAQTDPDEKTREAPSNSDEETRGAPLDPDEETREAPPNPEQETQEAPSDFEEETKDAAGLAAGSTDLEGLAVPGRRKLTISGNLPPNNVIAHLESTGARRRERSSGAKFSVDERGRRREECVDVRLWRIDDFTDQGGDTGADKEGHATGAVNRQQATNALEMGEWRKKVQGGSTKSQARGWGQGGLQEKYEGRRGQEEYRCRLST